MKKKYLAGALAAACIITACGQYALAQSGIFATDSKATQMKTTVLSKSSGNPMLGFDENGDILHAGDPSILVDGDTVYCYVGHDASSNESYRMPDWRCYSSKDMKNWTYESQIMTANRATISWAKDDVSAWAAQTAKAVFRML